LLNRKRVLVPVSLGPEGLQLLEQRPDLQVTRYKPAIAAAEFHALLGDAAAVALSWTPFRQPELAAAPRLEVVARLGVAEHALHLMFALAKRAAEMDRRVRQGIGHDRLSGLPGEVSGKTVLVVGFGRIGARTAPRCRAMEMEVLVYDPFVDAGVIQGAGYKPVADLDAALPRADFVTIHCPKNAETVGLFGAARLERMKPGAFLVNTARGGIVDEAALAAALASGHLGGAGLDVFDPEPPDPAHPLLQMETVIASPHMAGVTRESWAAMSATAALNILGVLDGAPNRANAVNPEVLRTTK